MPHGSTPHVVVNSDEIHARRVAAGRAALLARSLARSLLRSIRPLWCCFPTLKDQLKSEWTHDHGEQRAVSDGPKRSRQVARTKGVVSGPTSKFSRDALEVFGSAGSKLERIAGLLGRTYEQGHSIWLSSSTKDCQTCCLHAIRPSHELDFNCLRPNATLPCSLSHSSTCADVSDGCLQVPH